MNLDFHVKKFSIMKIISLLLQPSKLPPSHWGQTESKERAPPVRGSTAAVETTTIQREIVLKNKQHH